MNPFFDFPASLARFVKGTLARAADVNARFDEVSTGFDGVKTELDLKAPIASPTFTGTVTVPNPPSLGDDSTKAATTAWVQDIVGSNSTLLPTQTGKNTTLRTNGTVASWGYLDHIHVSEVLASGTSGGSCGAAATQIRALNTVVENTVTGASLASNKVTLPAGTYKVRAHAAGYTCNGQRLTLYNVTAGAAILAGPSSHASVAGFAQLPAMVSGVFTLSVSSEVRLDHYTGVARATSGLGVPVSDGSPEIYADLELWRTA